MSYYVYYNYGSCNDGDHAVGLEPFETLEEAKFWISVEVSRLWFAERDDFTIFVGRIVGATGDT